MDRKTVYVKEGIHTKVAKNFEINGVGIAKFFELAAEEKLARQAAASENFHPVLSTATEVKLSQNG